MGKLPINTSENKVHLELLAKKAVEGFITGLHKSPFHGFSVEFAEHKLYNTGDNLKYVDWKVYGRTNKLFSKKYEEETNLRCCIAIDTSTSMLYKNSDGKSKLSACVEASAILIEFLQKQLDACCLAFFDKDVHLLTKAGTSAMHKMNLFAHLESIYQLDKRPDKTSNICAALHELAERLHKRSLVIIFSDMLESGTESSHILNALRHLEHNKHDIIVFMVGDKLKEWALDLPQQAYEFKDAETGERIQLLPYQIKSYYTQKVNDYIKDLSEYCLSVKAGFHLFDINQDPAEVLFEYLIKRKKMM